jgi:hypothetical protein
VIAASEAFVIGMSNIGVKSVFLFLEVRFMDFVWSE